MHPQWRTLFSLRVQLAATIYQFHGRVDLRLVMVEQALRRLGSP